MSSICSKLYAAAVVAGLTVAGVLGKPTCVLAQALKLKWIGERVNTRGAEKQ